MKTRNLLFGSILGLGLLTCITSCEEKIEEIPTKVPIELDCDYFNTDRVLIDDPEREVDYYITCVMNAEADITIEPGVVIEFASDAGIKVSQTGSLSAVGTGAEPINLTGEEKVKGSWKGLLFESNNTKNKLHHTSINYAGGGEFNSNGDVASIIIWRFAKLSIQSSSILNSANYGISANYDESNWSITASTVSFADNSPISMLPLYFNSLDGTNSYTNNLNNFIFVELYIHYIEENTTIKKLEIPYQVSQNATGYNTLRIDGADVIIEPGTIIQFEDATGMFIEDDASLNAIGSIASPIIFTGTTKTKGAWGGIYFDSTTSISNQIKNATIEYAGNAIWQSGLNAGVIMWFNPYINLEKVTFQYIDGCSIQHKSSPIGPNPNLSYTNLTHTDTDDIVCNN